MPKRAPASAAAQSTLPAKYLKWLELRGRKRRVSYANQEWELATEKQLAKIVNIDGRRGPYVEQARLFVQTLAEFMPHATDTTGKEFPLQRIEQFLTLGSDNEDLLCVDPANDFSVWCFAPSEGGYVELIASSLDKWMQDVTDAAD